MVVWHVAKVGVRSGKFLRPMSKVGIKNYLVSYLDVGENKLGLEDLARIKNIGGRIFIDSGAYTLSPVRSGGMGWDKGKIYNYLERYVSWLNKNIHIWDICVELDIPWLIGYEEQERIRREYFLPLKRKGKQVIFVWHPSHKEDTLSPLLKEEAYRFVGIAKRDTKTINEYKNIILRMKNIGKMVHGFGMTTVSILREIPFDSVDSASAAYSIMKSRVATEYDGVKGQFISKGQMKELLIKYLRGKYQGIDILRYLVSSSLFSEEVYMAWLKMEEEINRLWSMRGVEFGSIYDE